MSGDMLWRVAENLEFMGEGELRVASWGFLRHHIYVVYVIQVYGPWALAKGVALEAL